MTRYAMVLAVGTSILLGCVMPSSAQDDATPQPIAASAALKGLTDRRKADAQAFSDARNALQKARDDMDAKKAARDKAVADLAAALEAFKQAQADVQTKAAALQATVAEIKAAQQAQ